MSSHRLRFQSTIFLPLLSVACLLLCGIVSATPSITLSKKVGPPTSRILVSGRGFEPNVGVDIFFHTKDRALVVTNGKGEFHNATIFVPRSARPGKHWVTALERNNDKGAQEPFLVQTDWSQFHFDADGTRLNPFENVLNFNTVGDLQLKWSYPTNNRVWSSPAVGDGVLYIGSLDWNVYALDAKTSSKLWSYRTRGPIYISSPAIADGIIYVGSEDHNVYALNASTGALVWSYSTGSYVLSSPAVANGVVYVSSEDGNLYALKASTGTLVWKAPSGAVSVSPAVASGVVYNSADNSVMAFDASTGDLLWDYATADQIQSSPAVANGVVYVGSYDDNVYALNASTGTLIWKYATGGNVYSSPAMANGVVYVGSEDNSLYALNASTGVRLWSYATGSLVESSPAVANGVVYVGSEYPDNKVYALSAKTGELLWSYTTGGGMDSSPTVVNGMVYAASYDDGNVFAFGLPEDGWAEQGISIPPDIAKLGPDFALKASQPVAEPSVH